MYAAMLKPELGMKTLFVYMQFLPNIGGTELPMYYYAKELTKRGHQVTVFTANAARLKPSDLKEREWIDGILVRRFRFFPIPFYNLFFFAPSLISNLFSVETDIVHVFSWIPSFFVLLPCFIAKIRKIPLVLYPQCFPQRFRYYPSIFKRFAGIFMDRIIGPRIMKRADHVIALTNREAEFYKKNGVKNVEVIREPIFLNASQKMKQLEFKRKHDIHEDDVVLLSVGRLAKYKGIHILIKSLPKVLKYIPNIKLLVIGEDWGFFSECVKLTKRFNCERNVIFTGRVSDEELSCAYEIADFVVMPSFFEGMGRVVFEAWAHSKPVIVTNSVGLGELVASRGGIVVRTGDSTDLANAIIKLASDFDLVKSLGKNGHKLLLEQITWEVAVTRLENIYSSLCARTSDANRHEGK